MSEFLVVLQIMSQRLSSKGDRGKALFMLRLWGHFI